MSIRTLLLEHHFNLERSEGRHITVKELSERIGMYYPTFNHIYNERRPPTNEQVDQLYDFFQDLRFYDEAGLPRPDLILRLVTKKWGQMSDETKDKISRLVNIDKPKGGARKNGKTEKS